MGRVVIIIVVVIVLLVGAAAGIYFFGPDDLKQTIGLAPPPTPTPNNPGIEPTEDPGVDIVVAKIDLDVGTFITDTQMLLDIDNISTIRYEEQQDELFRSGQLSEVFEKVLTVPVIAGDPIKKAFLTDPGLAQRLPTAESNRPRPKAYPLLVDTFSGVGNQIVEGDVVDVVATFRVERKVFSPAAAPPTPTPIPDNLSEEEVALIEEDAASQQFTEAFFSAFASGPPETREFYSTKTIVQRAKVLAIILPPPTPTPVPVEEGEEAEEPPPEEDQAAPPTEEEEDGGGRTMTVGMWQVVIGVNDQQAELLEFAQSAGAKITLVLRGAGDQNYEETIGTTFDLMLSEFGLPNPEPINPFVYAPEVLTPQPTRTPVPTIRVP